MNYMRWVQFFEDNESRLSSTRLTVIVGAAIGSAVVLIDAIGGKTSEAIFGLFLGYCGGVYGMMKFSDNSVTKASINSTAAPTVNVANIENADKLTGTGNVSVNP